MPGGVNSPVRAFGSVHETPRFFVSASGPYVTDVEGREYADLVGSWGPAILGHAHPAVVKAVQDAAAHGLGFGASTPGATLLPALSSALMATAHGAGLMLVPALMPLCMSGLPAREITASGSLLLGLAAVIVHLAAMLLTASGIACLLQAGARGWRQRGLGSAASWCSLALAVAGVGMIAMA